MLTKRELLNEIANLKKDIAALVEFREKVEKQLFRGSTVKLYNPLFGETKQLTIKGELEHIISHLGIKFEYKPEQILVKNNKEKK